MESFCNANNQLYLAVLRRKMKKRGLIIFPFPSTLALWLNVCDLCIHLVQVCPYMLSKYNVHVFAGEWHCHDMSQTDFIYFLNSCYIDFKSLNRFTMYRVAWYQC